MFSQQKMKMEQYLLQIRTDEIIDLEFDVNLPLGDFFATDDELKMSYCPLKEKILPNTVLLIKTK